MACCITPPSPSTMFPDSPLVVYMLNYETLLEGTTVSHVCGFLWSLHPLVSLVKSFKTYTKPNLIPFSSGWVTPATSPTALEMSSMVALITLSFTHSFSFLQTPPSYENLGSFVLLISVYKEPDTSNGNSCYIEGLLPHARHNLYSHPVRYVSFSSLPFYGRANHGTEELNNSPKVTNF